MPVDTINEIRTYKPFVDGLRAVAILTVVASHVDVPGLSGGYVGVDIFFCYLRLSDHKSNYR